MYIRGMYIRVIGFAHNIHAANFLSCTVCMCTCTYSPRHAYQNFTCRYGKRTWNKGQHTRSTCELFTNSYSPAAVNIFTTMTSYANITIVRIASMD